MKLQSTFTLPELGRWVLNEENRIWKFFWKQRQNTKVWFTHYRTDSVWIMLVNNAYCDYDSRNTGWECFGVLKTPIWDTVQVNSHVAGKRWLYYHLISGCILELFCFSQAWTLLSNTAMDKGDDYMGFLTFCFASVFIYILRSVPNQDFNFWPSMLFSSLCFTLFLLWCNKTMQSKSWKFQVAFTAC